MTYISNYEALRASAARLRRKARLSPSVARRVDRILPPFLAKQEDCLTILGTTHPSQGKAAEARFRLSRPTARRVERDLKTLRHVEEWAGKRQDPVADSARRILEHLGQIGYADLRGHLDRWRSLRKRQGNRDSWTRLCTKAERVEVRGHVFMRVRSLAELSSIGHSLSLCVAKGRPQAPGYWKRMREDTIQFWSISALAEQDGGEPSLIGLLSVGKATNTILEAQGRDGEPLFACRMPLRHFARKRGLSGEGCADLGAVGLGAAFLHHVGQEVASGTVGGEPFRVWWREGTFRFCLGKGHRRWGYLKLGKGAAYEQPYQEGAGLDEATAMQILLIALAGSLPKEIRAEVTAALQEDA
jgi:hypothetical protein